MKRHIIFLSLVLVVLILSTEARAEIFGFECITNPSNSTAAAIGAQLTVDVTAENGGSQVLFTFYNEGPLTK